MVKSIEIVTPFGNRGVKKAVYLQNQEVNLINESDDSILQKFIKALDLADAKLLIILNRSLGVQSLMKVSHPECQNTAEGIFKCEEVHLLSSEISSSDAKVVEVNDAVTLFVHYS